MGGCFCFTHTWSSATFRAKHNICPAAHPRLENGPRHQRGTREAHGRKATIERGVVHIGFTFTAAALFLFQKSLGVRCPSNLSKTSVFLLPPLSRLSRRIVDTAQHEREAKGVRLERLPSESAAPAQHSKRVRSGGQNQRNTSKTERSSGSPHQQRTESVGEACVWEEQGRSRIFRVGTVGLTESARLSREKYQHSSRVRDTQEQADARLRGPHPRFRRLPHFQSWLEDPYEGTFAALILDTGYYVVRVADAVLLSWLFGSSLLPPLLMLLLLLCVSTRERCFNRLIANRARLLWCFVSCFGLCKQDRQLLPQLLCSINRWSLAAKPAKQAHRRRLKKDTYLNANAKALPPFPSHTFYILFNTEKCVRKGAGRKEGCS